MQTVLPLKYYQYETVHASNAKRMCTHTNNKQDFVLYSSFSMFYKTEFKSIPITPTKQNYEKCWFVGLFCLIMTSGYSWTILIIESDSMLLGSTNQRKESRSLSHKGIDHIQNPNPFKCLEVIGGSDTESVGVVERLSCKRAGNLEKTVIWRPAQKEKLSSSWDPSWETLWSVLLETWRQLHPTVEVSLCLMPLWNLHVLQKQLMLKSLWVFI